MKHKLIAQQPQANDQNYINSIYSNLVQKINMLDKLNQEYKEKQQGHFLKTFMNVIEKLGKQLILAQEAYKNVDFQAKKDTYCLQLAQQVNFFKAQSVNLSKTLISTKQELKRLKMDKQILQNELLFTKNLYQKQTNSYLMLKTELKELKNQLKALTLGKHHSLFNSTGISTANYDLISKEFQGKSNSLDKKGQKLKETLNAESLYEKQKNQIKDYDAFDSFQKERKNRNSLTLTPVAQIDRFPKHGNLTQRCFRAKKQPKERNSNMPMQYCLE